MTSQLPTLLVIAIVLYLLNLLTNSIVNGIQVRDDLVVCVVAFQEALVDVYVEGQLLCVVKFCDCPSQNTLMGTIDFMTKWRIH